MQTVPSRSAPCMSRKRARNALFHFHSQSFFSTKVLLHRYPLDRTVPFRILCIVSLAYRQIFLRVEGFLFSIQRVIKESTFRQFQDLSLSIVIALQFFRDRRLDARPYLSFPQDLLIILC